MNRSSTWLISFIYKIVIEFGTCDWPNQTTQLGSKKANYWTSARTYNNIKMSLKPEFQRPAWKAISHDTSQAFGQVSLFPFLFLAYNNTGSHSCSPTASIAGIMAPAYTRDDQQQHHQMKACNFGNSYPQYSQSFHIVQHKSWHQNRLISEKQKTRTTIRPQSL